MFDATDFQTTMHQPRWLISLAASLVDEELYLFGGTGHGLAGVLYPSR